MNLAAIGSVAFAACVGLLVAVLFQERLEAMKFGLVARFWGGRGTKVGKVGGVWVSQFWYHGVDGAVHSVLTLMRCHQGRNRAIFKTEDGDGMYVVDGQLDGQGVLTCSWQNVKGASRYHGGGQFFAAPEGDSFTGMWVGWNKDRHVSAGPWVLVQVDDHKNLDLHRLYIELSRSSDPSGQASGEETRRIFNRIGQIVQSQSSTYRGASWAEAARDLASRYSPGHWQPPAL